MCANHSWARSSAWIEHQKSSSMICVSLLSWGSGVQIASGPFFKLRIMKKTKFIGIITAFFVIASILFNLANAETEQEKLDRMLKQFDNPSAMHGKMIVSFTETTTKEQAESILNEMGAVLQKNKVCEGMANPGEIPKETGCEEIDSWDDNLKIATVNVAIGQEKILAKKFYDIEEILWVEPVYKASIADDGITPEEDKMVLPLEDSEDTEQMPLGNAGQVAIESADIFERFWTWLKNLFI